MIVAKVREKGLGEYVSMRVYVRAFVCVHAHVSSTSSPVADARKLAKKLVEKSPSALTRNFLVSSHILTRRSAGYYVATLEPSDDAATPQQRR